jgi:hypothetical protein
MTQVKRRFRILAIKAIFREEIMAYCVAYRRVMAARFPELNNMSEQTRMSDLFHKNDRTEHYTWKVHPSPPLGAPLVEGWAERRFAAGRWRLPRRLREAPAAHSERSLWARCFPQRLGSI